MDNAEKKGLILVTTGAVFWGISGTVSKKLFQQTAIDVNWLVATRLLIAGILLLTIHFLAKDRSQILAVWKNKRSALRLVICYFRFGRYAIGSIYVYGIDPARECGRCYAAAVLSSSHDHHLFDSAETNDLHA